MAAPSPPNFLKIFKLENHKCYEDETWHNCDLYETFYFRKDLGVELRGLEGVAREPLENPPK